MAPEQAAGQANELTAAADIYGLGAVLYQTLTGHPPFAGGTTYETIRLVLETEPQWPSLWNRKLDRDLETICLKCLEKDPHKRYASGEALAEDLERWLRHEPIRARPSNLFVRTRKWARRHQVASALIPAAAALTVVSGLLLWQAASRHQPTETFRSLAVVLKPADTNSVLAARECSRELNRFSRRCPG